MSVKIRSRFRMSTASCSIVAISFRRRVSDLPVSPSGPKKIARWLSSIPVTENPWRERKTDTSEPIRPQAPVLEQFPYACASVMESIHKMVYETSHIAYEHPRSTEGLIAIPHFESAITVISGRGRLMEIAQTASPYQIHSAKALWKAELRHPSRDVLRGNKVPRILHR